jgi:hypothetical protein
MIFKVKRANHITRFAIFTFQPSWGDLATRISGLFDIPFEDIVVVFIKNKGPVPLSNDEELQSFYKSLDKLTRKSNSSCRIEASDIWSLTMTWFAGSNLIYRGGDVRDKSLGCLDSTL